MFKHRIAYICSCLLLLSCSSLTSQHPVAQESAPPPAKQAPVSQSAVETPNPPPPVQISQEPVSKQELSIAELVRFPDVFCDPSAMKRTEVRARHIPIEVPQHPTEFQIRAAYERAMQARVKIEEGASFALVESEYGKGASSRGVNGGDLGYFKKGIMVPEFERMAFCLPVHQLSPVFASFFGFHILEVTAVRQ